MNFVLLGYPDTERTAFFLKAAAELKIPVRFIEGPSFNNVFRRGPAFPSVGFSRCRRGPDSFGKSEELNFNFSQLQNSIVKVDPPLLNCYIGSMNSDMDRYINYLQKLEEVPGITLLNKSDAIQKTLDKFECKQRLLKAGIPITQALGSSDNISSEAQLKKIMIKKKIFSVFIKPRYGSGSAGIIAYRLNPGTKKSIIETSAMIKEGFLINTKKLRKIKDPAMIKSITNHVLRGGALVESWVPKSLYNGKAYDLRAVFQFGRLEYLVARQSRGPITNLHLNNDALAAENLNLDSSLMAELEVLCQRAALEFPGLNVAGFDILINKNGKPMIIEINGQGDLIYLDLFAENRIYKSQITAMKNLLLTRSKL